VKVVFLNAHIFFVKAYYARLQMQYLPSCPQPQTSGGPYLALWGVWPLGNSPLKPVPLLLGDVLEAMERRGLAEVADVLDNKERTLLGGPSLRRT
jgi:hypothetical protein